MLIPSAHSLQIANVMGVAALAHGWPTSVRTSISSRPNAGRAVTPTTHGRLARRKTRAFAGGRSPSISVAVSL
jgi:hypothetical protein